MKNREFNLIIKKSQLRLYIKYMVSLRCKNLVKAKLDKFAIPYLNVELGYADLPSSIMPEVLNKFNEELKKMQLKLESVGDSFQLMSSWISTLPLSLKNWKEKIH